MKQNLSDIAIGVDKVANCLHGLNTLKTSGSNGLPSRLLKECAQQIAPSICTLFNHSLQCGPMPLEWKLVNIIPLHKKQLKKPSRKLLSHFSPSYSQQSFGMLCVFPISLHINMVFYKIVPVLHNCSLCFILYDKNLIRMNRLTW